MRHPLHPALVHFPIACWSLATAGDLLSLMLGEQAWRLSGLLLLAGIGFSLPAMLAGLLELTRLPGDSPLMRHVNRHMFMVLCALAFYTASLFLRLHGTRLVEPGVLAIGSSVIGFVCLAVAGWLGGQLVYAHGVGVTPPGERSD